MDNNTLMYMLSTSFSLAEANGFKLPESKEIYASEKNFINYIERRKQEYSDEKISFLENIGAPTNRHFISNIFTRDDGFTLFIYFHNKSDNNKNIIANIQLNSFSYSIIVSEDYFHISAAKNFEEINVRDGVHDKNVFTVITYTDEEFVDQLTSPFRAKVMQVFRNGKGLPPNIEIRNMPNLLHLDPISKFYLGKPNDVFLIKRQTGFKNSILNEELVYRRVVKQMDQKKK